jgi:hypothetical protein
MDGTTSRWPNVSLMIESIARDVSYAGRLLWKDLTATVVTVVSLSLAIGACTASFSLIDALLLRPLPVRDPHQLVNVVHRAVGDDVDAAWFDYPVFERMRSASRSYVQLFGMSTPSRRDAVFDDGDGRPEKVYAQWISGDAWHRGCQGGCRLTSRAWGCR